MNREWVIIEMKTENRKLIIVVVAVAPVIVLTAFNQNVNKTRRSVPKEWNARSQNKPAAKSSP